MKKNDYSKCCDPYGIASIDKMSAESGPSAPEPFVIPPDRYYFCRDAAGKLYVGRFKFESNEWFEVIAS